MLDSCAAARRPALACALALLSSAWLQGCGGAGPEETTSTTTTTPLSSTASLATTTHHGPAPSGKSFCCYWPRDGSLEHICATCEATDENSAPGKCKSPGTWCGAGGPTTAPSSSGAVTTTKSAGPTTPATTVTTTTAAVKYQRAKGYSDGDFCAGAYGSARKALQALTAQQCAAAAAADLSCSAVFYFGSAASGKPALCRCVMAGVACIRTPNNPNDDYKNIIYEIEQGAVSFARAQQYKDGQFCAGAYGHVRKALSSAAAAASAEGCAQAAASDFECGQRFYFGKTTDGTAGICRCLLAGQECSVAENNPSDPYWNAVYEFSQELRPSAPHMIAAGYPDGQWCGDHGGEIGSYRKTLDAYSATVSSAFCAQAVARDFECGQLFYFAHETGSSNGECGCVLRGEACYAEGARPGSSSTILELTNEASSFGFDVRHPNDGNRASSMTMHRGHTYESHDAKDPRTNGRWTVRQFNKLNLDWEFYSPDVLSTQDHGGHFTNADGSVQLSSAHYPAWFTHNFYVPGTLQV